MVEHVSLWLRGKPVQWRLVRGSREGQLVVTLEGGATCNIELFNGCGVQPLALGLADVENTDETEKRAPARALS
eukprot:12815974-Alexandrium_andersonii.AAC.1